jgi:hypothetical protein
MKSAFLKYSTRGLVTFIHASVPHYQSSCDHMFKGTFLLILAANQSH